VQTRSWDDPEGLRHSRTEVVAHEMVMLDGRPGSEPDEMDDDEELGF
jgi:single-stranded DNA-binding protein